MALAKKGQAKGLTTNQREARLKEAMSTVCARMATWCILGLQGELHIDAPFSKAAPQPLPMSLL
jgi:hypothetical protein